MVIQGEFGIMKKKFDRSVIMSKYYYGVQAGRSPGVYKSWDECQAQVKGYKGAKYRKFKNHQEAIDFAEARTPVSCEGKNDIIKLKDVKANEMVAYVDGSFNLESMTYSYGVVVITKNGKETFKGKEEKEGLAQMRNVSGELKAAMVAMEIARERGVNTLYLHYDYYGIEKWALGQWKTNKEGTKAYKEFYDSIKGDINVVFVKVAAHTGVKYNEEADKLAKEALL